MFLQTSYLGIDIKVDLIKVAHIVRKGNISKINGLFQIKNPIGKIVFENQQEKERIQQVLANIKRKFPCCDAIMGIPSNHAVFRYINFPFLNNKELREAIFWEMQEFNTVFSDEYISDYEILEENDNNICRVLLVAVVKDMAMTYANILRGAGFYVKALDVYPLANARVFKTLNIPGVWAIIDLNDTHNEITIVENGKLILNRNLDISKDISMEKMVREISKIFNFYSLQSKSQQIGEILLLGKAKEQKDFLKSHFNVSVYTDIMGKLTAEKLQIDDNFNDFISAIGFALRG